MCLNLKWKTYTDLWTLSTIGPLAGLKSTPLQSCLNALATQLWRQLTRARLSVIYVYLSVLMPALHSLLDNLSWIKVT